jgi:hypothetical protein
MWLTVTVLNWTYLIIKIDKKFFIKVTTYAYSSCITQLLRLINIYCPRLAYSHAPVKMNSRMAQLYGLDNSLFIHSVQLSGIPLYSTFIFSTRRINDNCLFFSSENMWFLVARMSAFVCGVLEPLLLFSSCFAALVHRCSIQ